MIYVVVILVILVTLLVFLYNRIVTLKLRCDNAWASIDNQLKRRADLIPNLVEVTKGYASYECETLQELVKLRSNSVSEEGIVSNKISKSINKIFAVAEAYPDLKSNELYKNLQLELVGTEDKIAYARQFYNDCVQFYNTKIMMFPNNLFAKMLKFTEKEYFQVNEEDKKNVSINL